MLHLIKVIIVMLHLFITATWITLYRKKSTSITTMTCFIENTAQKMKFSIKDFFSKCDQIRRFLWIWSYLLKKYLMENFIFCAVKTALSSKLNRRQHQNKTVGNLENSLKSKKPLISNGLFPKQLGGMLPRKVKRRKVYIIKSILLRRWISWKCKTDAGKAGHIYTNARHS